MPTESTKQTTPQVIHLKDYKEPDYFISEVSLHFDLHDAFTRVKSNLQITRNSQEKSSPPLILNGEHLKLISVCINGEVLDESGYEVTDDSLTIRDVPQEFTLETEIEIDPASNKALEGLYKSGDIYCTQNEPQGFRRITYYIDRSDVMSKFATTITADKKKYPILLSNGNEMDRGDLDKGRHFVKWEDPFKKPSYLFALVAGDLGMIEDSFTTMSGRKIMLRIYVDKGNEKRSFHAMESLKKAMKWDEETFGREYDLDLFMIVAVDAFNQGAMENKGLNIFNSHYILADPETATDADYENILGVVGHEYFHNWTGNRITCRDWFQITLKEGLTVFRDEEFTADMTSRPVKRIHDVRILREYQFVEDASPMAHPIQPKSYIEVNNFYTTTVYNKGAAVIRMIYTLLGKEAFRSGMDYYFDTYDGQAVTTEEFVHSMEKGGGIDLSQFRLWYDQAGTPVCKVTADYDAIQKTYSLTVEQECPPTPEAKEKKPFYFPLTVSLFGADGKELASEKNLSITKEKETFVFENIAEKPIPSLLRGFSAPVKLEYDYSEEDLLLLLSSDTDSFNRYEAGQRLATAEMNRLMDLHQAGKELSIDAKSLDAFAKVLQDDTLDSAFQSQVFVLPTLTALTEPLPICDYETAFRAKEFFIKAFAKKHEDLLHTIYQKLNDGSAYKTDSESIGKRSLKNVCLSYLLEVDDNKYVLLAYEQFEGANNMTDQMAALVGLCHRDSEETKKALQSFYQKWQKDSVVIDKWFAVQAVSKLPGVLGRIEELAKDPAFDAKNPNKLRSLYGAFTRNLVQFHDISGDGYRVITNKILEMDQFNSMIAARFTDAFKKYGKLDATRKTLMKEQLEKILHTEGLSKNVFEVASKILNG